MKKRLHFNERNAEEMEGSKNNPLELDISKIKKISEDEIVDENKSDTKEENKEEYPPISFFKLFRYSTGMEKFWLLFAILCSLATATVAPLNSLFFGYLTTAMVDYGLTLIPNTTKTFYFIPESRVERFLIRPFYSSSKNITVAPFAETIAPSQKAIDALIEAIFEFAIQNTALGVGIFIFTYFSINIFNWVAENQVQRIRNLYFRSVLSQDISWYDMNQTGDLASRMADDVSKLEDGIGEKCTMFVFFIGSFIGSIVLSLTMGWKLALVCLSSFPVILISVTLVSVVTSRLSRNELEAYGQAGSIAEETLTAIRTVFSFNGQYKESERYKKNLIFAYKNNVKRGFFGGLGFGLLWFFIYASYGLAFWYGVGLVLEERPLDDNDKVYTPGTMVTVFFGVMMGSMYLGMSSPLIEAFGIAKGAAAKIYALIERESSINPFSKEGEQPESVQGDISFKNVRFNYPSRPNIPILRGLDLKIKRGETLALVGSSGCGKSTCVQLIQRFYDPLDGTIELDGRDIKNLNVSWLRSQIGVVGQEPVLFQMSVEENIRFGREGCTKEEIINASKAANAHDFIMKLPKGYDTLVGERGTQMSGGQKQRIAIARALVRDPSILLLDEATSALDTNSEAKVQQALDKASIGRTTIIVAHRLSTIKNADRIVVFDNGQIIEEGDHQTLMKIPNGIYADLVKSQTINTEGPLSPVSPDTGHEGAPVFRKQSQVSENSEKYEEDEFPNQMQNQIAEEDNIEKESSFTFWELMRRNSPEWHYITVGCIGSVIIGFAMPVFSLLFGNILGVLSVGAEAEVRSETNMLCIYFVIAGVVIGISTLLQIWTFGVAGEGLTMRIRGDAFDAIISQDISWFDDDANGVGTLCARLSGDASAVQGATGQRIGIMFQSVATLGLGVGVAMYYSWKLGLVAMAFIPVIFVAIYNQSKTQKKNKKVGNQSFVERSTKVAVEAVSNIRTVAGLNREETFHLKYSQELKKKTFQKFNEIQKRGLTYSLSRSIMFFAYATCIWYGGRLIIWENMPYEDVFKVSQALIMSTMSLANAMSFAPNFQKGWVAAKKIFQLLAREPQIQDSPSAAENENWDKGDVTYNDIDFRYPTRPTVTVLRGLNLKASDGKTIALVGSSGCGKSTCIQLLERFYDPPKGKITLDGKDISTVRQRNLRYQLGLVSQEPILFARTIKENIQYGDNDREVTTEEVIEVAKKSNIHNFIANLPLGYDTLMGEKGTQLSGGQKQRVAIARALVRKPKVLLLDEATSALDAESEKVVQEALDKAKEGRTCITIAHRLSTIQDADIIYVLDRGMVKEAGTHSQLVARRGLYYRLVKLQT